MITRRDNDQFELARFLEAQEATYEIALSELRAGRKHSHWMWFVFPQIDGLGSSPIAKHYAIKSLEEARGYLSHPLLGTRLVDCTKILLNLKALSAPDIFGYPDDLKFCSSMTLFEHVSAEGSLFSDAIRQYCGGQRDARTLAVLDEMRRQGHQ